MSTNGTERALTGVAQATKSDVERGSSLGTPNRTSAAQIAITSQGESGADRIGETSVAVASRPVGARSVSAHDDPLERAHDEVSTTLYRALAAAVPDQMRRIMGSRMVDIEPQFMGFVATYRLLALLIPRDWTVVDLGCAYAPQCWYFRAHRRYVGVDLGSLRRRFAMPNTLHLRANITDVLAVWRASNPLETFAICNYVPPWHGFERRAIAAVFPNLFSFYPAPLSCFPLRSRPTESAVEADR